MGLGGYMAGKILEVYHNGIQTVLVIETDKGNKLLYLPASGVTAATVKTAITELLAKIAAPVAPYVDKNAAYITALKAELAASKDVVVDDKLKPKEGS